LVYLISFLFCIIVIHIAKQIVTNKVIVSGTIAEFIGIDISNEENERNIYD